MTRFNFFLGHFPPNSATCVIELAAKKKEGAQMFTRNTNLDLLSFQTIYYSTISEVIHLCTRTYIYDGFFRKYSLGRLLLNLANEGCVELHSGVIGAPHCHR